MNQIKIGWPFDRTRSIMNISTPSVHKLNLEKWILNRLRSRQVGCITKENPSSFGNLDRFGKVLLRVFWSEWLFCQGIANIVRDFEKVNLSDRFVKGPPNTIRVTENILQFILILFHSPNRERSAMQAHAQDLLLAVPMDAFLYLQSGPPPILSLPYLPHRQHGHRFTENHPQEWNQHWRYCEELLQLQDQLHLKDEDTDHPQRVNQDLVRLRDCNGVLAMRLTAQR